MLQKILTYVNTALIIVLVLASFGVFNSYKLGAAPSTATTYGDLNLSTTYGGADIYVDGTAVTANDVWVGKTALGGTTNTNFTSENCATSTWNPPAVTTGSPASIEVSVTGATIAQNQVYYGGFNTSTLGLALTFNGSGTAGVIVATLSNTIAGAGVNPATGTISACYKQF